MDLSLQNSGPFICEGGSSEPTEPPLATCLWLMVNRLKLNVSKSHCMLIGSRQRTGGKYLHLMLDGDVLRQISTTKYLGV